MMIRLVWKPITSIPRDEGVEIIALLYGGDVARLKWWSDSDGSY